MNSTISCLDAQQRFGTIINDATAGNVITITSDGKPAVVIIGADDYEGLLETLDILSDDDTMAAIREGIDDLRCRS
jgi:antitoxin YefM